MVVGGGGWSGFCKGTVYFWLCAFIYNTGVEEGRGGGEGEASNYDSRVAAYLHVVIITLWWYEVNISPFLGISIPASIMTVRTALFWRMAT